MTKAGILQDFFLQQEWDRLEAEEIKKAIDENTPLCLECGYKGQPNVLGYCPACGMQMQTGDVYENPEFDEHLKRLGLTREDIK